MKVAVIQFGAGKDKEHNVRQAAALVKKAARARAKFILLPEVFVYRGKTGLAQLRRVAEKIPGPTTKTFSALAKKHKAFILLGSLYERVGKGKVYNTSVLLNPRGVIQARYRKTNLFDARIGRHKIRESAIFRKGKKTALTKIGPFKVGMTICFDLRFSELYFKYARQGADIFVVPSAFTRKTGQAHWKHLLCARAIENQCYVLAPNQIGKDSRGIISYGHSMVIHPWGNVLAEASGARNQIVYATLKKEDVQRTKKTVNMKR